MRTPVVKLDRRNFLKSSAMVAGGLVLGFYLPDANEAEAQSPASSVPVRMNAFIQIAPDDTVTMTIHKPEFGQGTVTSFHSCWRKSSSAIGRKSKRSSRTQSIPCT